MSPTKHTAGTDSPPKTTGLLATLGGFRHVKGTGAPSHPRSLATSATLLTALAALAFSAAPALAAAPEEPESQPATLVTSTTATLNGVLNPLTSATAGWYFAYTPEFACGIAPVFAPEFPGAAEEAVHAKHEEIKVEGLQPNRQYTFCMVATSELGVNVTPSAAEPKFKTQPAPPTILSESAPAPKATSAKLEALLNPNNQTTKYGFEYSTVKQTVEEGKGTKLPGASELPEEFNPGGTAVSVETKVALAEHEVYYYRVVAENAQSVEEGKPVVGKVESFLTGPPETPVEAKVKAGSITASSVEVEGVLNPGKVGEPGSTYEFLYKEGNTGCEGGHAAPEPAAAAHGHEKERVSTKITGLQPNKEYTFCLIATNAAGEKTSAAAEPVTFSTHAGPPTISESSAENVTETTATITAKVNPEGLDTHVYVQYGQNTAPLDVGALVGEQKVKIALTALQPNTTYSFHVIAFNDEGKVEGEGSFKTLKTPPTPPPHGETPWWHATIGTAPSSLQPSAERDAVQRVTVTGEGAGAFIILNDPESVEGAGVILPWDATPAEVQAGLEGEELYGSGNVLVSSPGPGVYEVKFVGARADRPVELLTGGSFFPTEVQLAISEVTVGSYAGEVLVFAENRGDADSDGAGAGNQIAIKDSLPAGLRAIHVEGVVEHVRSIGTTKEPLECTLTPLECTYRGVVAPYRQAEVKIAVDAAEGAAEVQEDRVALSGGGALGALASRRLPLGRPVTFGLEQIELAAEEQGGAPDRQAGSHPFQLTTSFSLDQSAVAGSPPALPKDLAFNLPPGLFGNPTPFPRCPETQFTTSFNNVDLCPADTAIGVSSVTLVDKKNLGPLPVTETVPIFNLRPEVGEPARFGFDVDNVPVILDTSVRSGGDYGVTVTSHNIAQTVTFIGDVVTFWGVPGDPRHDSSRGWSCIGDGERRLFAEHLPPCSPLGQEQPPPFLTMPTACSGEEPAVTAELDSWSQPTVLQPLMSTSLPTLGGCNRLPFTPVVNVTPDVQEASRPSGLTVDVHVPQDAALNGEGLAESSVKDITVTLPEGLSLNPSAADGLQACTLAQIGYTGTDPETGADRFTDEEASCPNASKIATATIHTPLLPNPLKGFVYLASPQNFAGMPPENPFRSLVAMYLVARDPVSGVLVKLPGEVSLSPSGQVTTSFANNPQLPFEDAELEFLGGERAPLATPALCRRPGEEGYVTSASLTPWSGNPAASASSEFDVTSGPGGSPCPNQPGDQSSSSLPFTASLASGTPNINAGGFSPLTTTISRPDGQQSIQNVTLHYPPGVSGILAGVPLCPEAQANAGTCPESSRIGETIVSVGVGGDPFTVTGGKVYLTESYAGAPFGLSIVNPAKAGPFDLEEGRPVVVRAKIEIDPSTAALTIQTTSIPKVIDGFPLQIQHVNVLINRPNFTFNPTNCDPMSITGQIGAWEGATSPVSDPFQATNCAALKFEPKVSVSTLGHASKRDGQSLTFKIVYPKGAMGSDAWVNEAKFDIPKQLPVELDAIQQACLAHTFETDRSACPVHSVIGHAIVRTQLLPVPLEGPVYFVSYGGVKFPDAVMVLSGYGVNVTLTGETFIDNKTGVTSATFPNTPDVPFESIEVDIPTGQYSEFGSNLPHESYDFCGQKLDMPTLFKASNGLEIHQQTPVTITGCAKASTRAQKLAAALKACRNYAKHGSERAACEAEARRRYGQIKKKEHGGAASSWAASAHLAGTLSLSETGHLHLTSHHSFTLNEQGSTSGTISGTIYIHLNIVSTNRVTAEVNIYPRGGSLTGYATASYRPSGAVATFAGTMTVARGSGRYAGAHGAGLSFTGTIQRSNDAVTVHVSGRIST